MEILLGSAAFACIYAGHPAGALLLRCALEACRRFSPRAAAALAGLCALCAALTALLFRLGEGSLSVRSGLHAASAAFLGGTLGRAALLMFTARFSGSLALSRLHAVPLVLLALCAVCLRLRFSLTESALFALFFLSGAADGFLGAGGSALLFAFLSCKARRRRHAPSSAELICTLSAQAGALALTLFCGAAQVFPGRMIALLLCGSALGALAAQAQKKRGALHKRMHAALLAYLVFAALSCAEQAFC